MKKNKFILTFFIVLFLVLSSSSALALEVTTYPQIPGLPIITNDTKLPDFVIYWFGLGIYLAGALSLISLTIGAVGIIGAGATGNPEGRKDSMDRIKGAGLGLILTMASFLIIQTINPVLTMPTLTPLGNLPGVYYTNCGNATASPSSQSGASNTSNTEVTGGCETKPAPISEADTSNIPEGFEKIDYTCDIDPETGEADGPALYIWLYPETNFSDEPFFPNTRVERVECNAGPVDLGDAGSFEMAYEAPGVYYFFEQNCQGMMSDVNISSQNEISLPFKGSIRSVKVINDPANHIYYGVIFHSEIGLENAGGCADPIIPNIGQTDRCENLPSTEGKETPVVAASAADIFLVNDSPLTSGNGTIFYSQPFGWNAGAIGGSYKIEKGSINPPLLNVEANKMKFSDYRNNTPDEYKKNKKGSDLTFQDKPGSIEIKGSYLVGLFSKKYFCGDGDCNGGENCNTCKKDCDACSATCGDGTCTAPETCASCQTDCKNCTSCGDGTCNGAESCSSCRADCGICEDDATCGDGRCDTTSETCQVCPRDCGRCTIACGDGKCEGGENCTTCSTDCGTCAVSCGNGACEPGETCVNCPGDCSSTCEPPDADPDKDKTFCQTFYLNDVPNLNAQPITPEANGKLESVKIVPLR